MLVAEYIVQILEKHGVKTVFGYQGANITYIIDEIAKSDISFVETRHEQAAAFAANAYAQSNNELGVAISSSGPGAINMLTGIANAYYDSIPCLFITGNVNSNFLNKNKNIRQNAFQEADIVSLVRPITKYACTVTSVDEISKVLEKSLELALTGRTGPVLIDIPHNIQKSELIEYLPVKFDKSIFSLRKEIDRINVKAITNYMEHSKKPLILVGGGMKTKKAKDLLGQLVNIYAIPIVSSLCGLDCLNNNVSSLGMIGSYGNPVANIAFFSCDLLIILGSRLADRQIVTDKIPYAPNAKLIHVDIDNNELTRLNRDKININASTEVFLETLLNEVKSNNRFVYESWGKTIFRWKQLLETKDLERFPVDYFIEILSDKINENSAICVDVGEHQMSVAQSIKLKNNCRLLNSAALGSMGYALPAAIGACYSNQFEKVYCLVGDGGFQMNLQELQTIAENNLPIIIIVINNKSLGMIKSYQEKVFDERYIGSVVGYSVPDLAGVANAFKIEYIKISHNKGCFDSIDKWIKMNKPVIVEYECDSDITHRYEPNDNYRILMQNIEKDS